MSGLAVDRIIESEVGQHFAAQIVDMHFRSEALAATGADGTWILIAGLLVQLDAELRGPLKDVKEFAERKKQESGDDRDRVQNRQEAIGFAAQPFLRNRQRESGD